MKDNSNTKTAGIGFTGILALIFITLKLLGKITWSWLWVLVPLWIPAIVALFMLVVIGIVYVIKN